LQSRKPWLIRNMEQVTSNLSIDQDSSDFQIDLEPEPRMA
jgi:hypothetical protein